MLIDTSVIVELLRHPSTSSDYKRIITELGEDNLYLSVIQLAELSDWCIKNGIEPNKHLEKIKKLTSILDLDESICIEAARIKNQKRIAGCSTFSLIDGIVIASARSISQRLLTFDRDFAGEKDCTVL